MKVKFCSLDGDIDFLDIVAGVLQGDALAPYLFIICLDYILWTLLDLMKENEYIYKHTYIHIFFSLFKKTTLGHIKIIILFPSY